MSDILPRADEHREKALLANELIASRVPSHCRAIHTDIGPEHLHDQVHLSKNAAGTQKYSGCNLLSRSIYLAINGVYPPDVRLSSPPRNVIGKRSRSGGDGFNQRMETEWHEVRHSEEYMRDYERFGPIHGTMV